MVTVRCVYIYVCIYVCMWCACILYGYLYGYLSVSACIFPQTLVKPTRHEPTLFSVQLLLCAAILE